MQKCKIQNLFRTIVHINRLDTAGQYGLSTVLFNVINLLQINHMICYKHFF